MYRSHHGIEVTIVKATRTTVMNKQKHFHRFSIIGARIGHDVVRTYSIKSLICVAKHLALNVNFQRSESSQSAAIDQLRQQLTSHALTLESP